MDCNLAPGKTGIALFLQGRGSRKARIPLYVLEKKVYVLSVYASSNLNQVVIEAAGERSYYSTIVTNDIGTK